MPSMNRPRLARLVAIGALAAAPVLVVAARAPAGPPVSNGTDTLQLEASVRPATTATRAHPRPVALTLTVRHSSESSVPATAATVPLFDLPDGMDVNLDPHPACRWSAVLVRGASGCVRRSQVGTGAAIIDGRPAGRGYPLQARVRVYSAVLDQPPPPRGFRPLSVLLVYAHAPGADVFIPYYPNRVRNPSALIPQNALTSVPFGIGLLDLRLSLRSVRWPKRKGGKPLVAAPTRCTGSWHFSVRLPSDLTATDDVPCRRGG
jgi:hypothetical protein